MQRFRKLLLIGGLLLTGNALGALQQSVTQRVGHAEQLADFSEGYSVWKSAYDAHQAGAFKTSVAQTLNDLLGGDWEESR